MHRTALALSQMVAAKPGICIVSEARFVGEPVESRLGTAEANRTPAPPGEAGGKR